MNFLDRIKVGWASFKGEGVINLPPRGRSSDESLPGLISSYLAQFGSITPVINFEMLRTLKCFWLYNPDFSQYIANIVNLGNPGHQLAIDAATDAVAEAALNRLNESASRIYDGGAGVDGLLNAYLTSVAWSGAISSEDVVNIAARRVEKVVQVPVEQIRFKYNKDLDRYEAYQKSNNLARTMTTSPGLIQLNPETYKYYALSTVENSPYAKPPATAAVDAILKGQQPIMENIQFMAQKVGLLGLVSVSVMRPPKKGGETEDEYRKRATDQINAVAAALDGNFNKGLVVTGQDQKVEHTPVTAGATGVYEINRMSEEQVFSGMAAMPGFHGRTDSTTETFADVVYYLLTAQVSNMQRVVKRRHEQTCRLDLRLAGIDVDGVSLTFNKAHSRNAKDEAMTEQIHLANVLTKVRSGAISPDEGAQELGLDSWFDENLLAAGIAPPQPAANDGAKLRTIKLSFDKGKQKYIHRPERYEFWSGADEIEAADTVVPFVKKKALAASN